MRGQAGQSGYGRGDLLGVATIATADGSDLEQLDVARVVRRALADARLKATQVASLVIDDAIVSAADLAAFARLALGGGSVDVDVARAPSSQVIGDAVATCTTSGGVTLAVIGGGDVAVALCLRSRRQSIVK